MRPADIQRSDGDAAVRDINASIARAYDLVGYEPPINDQLHPDNLLGLAALYGCVSAGGDVLDLGCGTGVQLDGVGDRMSGRLVGIDISRKAVARARKRCARFGQRADIRCADALDIDTDELGQFDLIYHVGVLYVTPPEVRRALVDVIRRCLKPGGVAVVSYYAGTVPAVRASVIRLLRTMDDPGAPVPARVSAIRRQLDDLARSAAAASRPEPLIRGVIQGLAATKDTVLFHECLNQVFDVIDTPALAAELAQGGLVFLTYLRTDQFSTLASPRERAFAAATADVVSGGYRYAVFGKPTGGAAGFNVRTPLVNWHLDMVRTETAEGAATFANAKTSINVTFASTAAALDALAQGPRTWAELCAAAMPHLDPADPEAGHRQLETDLTKLWRFGLAKPTRTPSAAA